MDVTSSSRLSCYLLSYAVQIVELLTLPMNTTSTAAKAAVAANNSCGRTDVVVARINANIQVKQTVTHILLSMLRI